MKTTFVTTAALALALTAHAEFKIDRSVMSDKYWAIWNDEVQAKIDADIELNLDILGYIDPGITVNVIRDDRKVEKKHLSLPEKLTGILKCKNPRCISMTEQELPQIFTLADKEKRVYRCLYCETQAGK